MIDPAASPGAGPSTGSRTVTNDGGRALTDDLTLALEIADALDTLTLSRFGALDLQVTTKPDASPVSDADVAAEELARELIAAAAPGDEILGEELGGTLHPTGRQWVIDPIDGTKNFVRGVPVWASLIGLLVDGEPVVGVVSAPALGRRWYAATGLGSWCLAGGPSIGVPRRLAVSGVGSLADASLSYASLDGWRERDGLEPFLDLLAAVWRTRAYGDFWSYMLVAEGAVDVAAEPELALHDMVALVPIVREAGGEFTSLTGQPGPFGGNAVASNGLLHAEVLERLRP